MISGNAERAFRISLGYPRDHQHLISAGPSVYTDGYIKGLNVTSVDVPGSSQHVQLDLTTPLS